MTRLFPVHYVGLVVSLCITTAITTTISCPSKGIKETLKKYLIPHVSSKEMFKDGEHCFTKPKFHKKLEGVFSEYYISSRMASSYTCACIGTTITEKETKHVKTRSSVLIGENDGKGKEVRLRVNENPRGLILFKEKVLLVAKMYPVFATDNVIAYVMCVPLKKFSMDGHTDLWATVMVRSDQLSNPELAKEIEEAHNKIKSLPLDKEVTTLLKRQQFCPECSKEIKSPAKT